MSQCVGIRPNEVFLGNFNDPNMFPVADVAHLKTLRLGAVALDIDGKRIPSSLGYRPMFIDRSEYQAYDAVMAERCRKIRRGTC